MLVSAKEMLNKAREGKYAVGQFNINNLEWTKAILLTAQENNSPVILGVSEGAGKYMCGYKTIVGMVNGMLEELNITVPVALHLDHGSYEGCYKAMEAGFSSVMFDGSHYPIAENIAHLEHREHDEHDALDEDDAQCRLERLQVAHAGQGDDVGHDDGKEAVESHAGRHGKGLVGRERHDERADGGSDARGEEHAVPELRAALSAEAGQQVRVERDDVRHGHERGEAGKKLGAHGGPVGLQLEKLFHDILPFSFVICPPI